MELMKFLKMYRVCHSNNLIKAGVNRAFLRNVSSTQEKKVEEEVIYSSMEDEDYETTMMERERELEIKRNKSRLIPGDRNALHKKVPYKEPMNDVHLTLQYKRRIFGRYGQQSNINPGTLWPNVDDIKKSLEYEQIAYPYSIQEMVARQKKKIEDEQKEINERQMKIANNLAKLNQWKKEIEDKTAKKLGDLAKAKAKKDALIEEVRKHFGYKVDPKDEKFKEMLIMKEREQKKKLKEERAKAKQERLIMELTKKDQ